MGMGCIGIAGRVGSAIGPAGVAAIGVVGTDATLGVVLVTLAGGAGLIASRLAGTMTPEPARPIEEPMSPLTVSSNPTCLYPFHASYYAYDTLVFAFCL